jgi:hypothetical protein
LPPELPDPPPHPVENSEKARQAATRLALGVFRTLAAGADLRKARSNLLRPRPWFPPFTKDAKDGARPFEMAHSSIRFRVGHPG